MQFAPLLPDLVSDDDSGEGNRQGAPPRFRIPPRFGPINRSHIFPGAPSASYFDPIVSEEDEDMDLLDDEDCHSTTSTNDSAAGFAKISPKKKRSVSLKQPTAVRPTIRVKPRRNSLGAHAA